MTVYEIIRRITKVLQLREEHVKWIKLHFELKCYSCDPC